MAKAISRLIEDENLRVEMGLAAAETARRKFSPENQTQQFLNMYGGLLSVA